MKKDIFELIWFVFFKLELSLSTKNDLMEFKDKVFKFLRRMHFTNIKMIDKSVFYNYFCDSMRNFMIKNISERLIQCFTKKKKKNIDEILRLFVVINLEINKIKVFLEEIHRNFVIFNIFPSDAVFNCNFESNKCSELANDIFTDIITEAFDIYTSHLYKNISLKNNDILTNQYSLSYCLSKCILYNSPYSNYISSTRKRQVLENMLNNLAIYENEGLSNSTKYTLSNERQGHNNEPLLNNNCHLLIQLIDDIDLENKHNDKENILTKCFQKYDEILPLIEKKSLEDENKLNFSHQIIKRSISTCFCYESFSNRSKSLDDEINLKFFRTLSEDFEMTKTSNSELNNLYHEDLHKLFPSDLNKYICLSSLINQLLIISSFSNIWQSVLSKTIINTMTKAMDKLFKQETSQLYVGCIESYTTLCILPFVFISNVGMIDNRNISLILNDITIVKNNLLYGSPIQSYLNKQFNQDSLIFFDISNNIYKKALEYLINYNMQSLYIFVECYPQSTVSLKDMGRTMNFLYICEDLTDVLKKHKYLKNFNSQVSDKLLNPNTSTLNIIIFLWKLIRVQHLIDKRGRTFLTIILKIGNYLRQRLDFVFAAADVVDILKTKRQEELTFSPVSKQQDNSFKTMSDVFDPETKVSEELGFGSTSLRCYAKYKNLETTSYALCMTRKILLSQQQHYYHQNTYMQILISKKNKKFIHYNISIYDTNIDMPEVKYNIEDNSWLKKRTLVLYNPSGLFNSNSNDIYNNNNDNVDIVSNIYIEWLCFIYSNEKDMMNSITHMLCWHFIAGTQTGTTLNDLSLKSWNYAVDCKKVKKLILTIEKGFPEVERSTNIVKGHLNDIEISLKCYENIQSYKNNLKKNRENKYLEKYSPINKRKIRNAYDDDVINNDCTVSGVIITRHSWSATTISCANEIINYLISGKRSCNEFNTIQTDISENEDYINEFKKRLLLESQNPTITKLQSLTLGQLMQDEYCSTMDLTTKLNHIHQCYSICLNTNLKLINNTEDILNITNLNEEHFYYKIPENLIINEIKDEFNTISTEFSKAKVNRKLEFIHYLTYVTIEIKFYDEIKFITLSLSQVQILFLILGKKKSDKIILLNNIKEETSYLPEVVFNKDIELLYSLKIILIKEKEIIFLLDKNTVQESEKISPKKIKKKINIRISEVKERHDIIENSIKNILIEEKNKKGLKKLRKATNIKAQGALTPTAIFEKIKLKLENVTWREFGIALGRLTRQEAVINRAGFYIIKDNF